MGSKFSHSEKDLTGNQSTNLDDTFIISLDLFVIRLFQKHKNIAGYYNAEDIDPDSIPKSQKFVMYAMQELQYFFKLPQVYGDDRKWKSALSAFKDHYEELDMPMTEFIKSKDALMGAMEKYAGGVSADQRKNWDALFDKAYADMKQWGWY
uniref:Globin family profile domain-containing protein n=1 Tax=Setaria digitata TaxID=48799 RepID=A0A915Q749_9BILA